MTLHTCMGLSNFCYLLFLFILNKFCKFSYFYHPFICFLLLYLKTIMFIFKQFIISQKFHYDYFSHFLVILCIYQVINSVPYLEDSESQVKFLFLHRDSLVWAPYKGILGRVPRFSLLWCP